MTSDRMFHQHMHRLWKAVKARMDGATPEEMRRAFEKQVSRLGLAVPPEWTNE